ncbi:MAG: CYTH domain-containing protein [Caldisericales bacterium]|nr:CYTH domain-containing protein [Caldisericales bacterium]
MVQFENESKYMVKKNGKAVEEAIGKLSVELGFILGEPSFVDQLDVYLDHDFVLKNSGYSLRNRYEGGVLKKITLKTLETLDEKNHIRIEEESSTYKDLMGKVTKKLKSIFQDPADETALKVLSDPEKLVPVVVLTKGRKTREISCSKGCGQFAFDTYTYIFPKTSNVFKEIEIEGPSFLDSLRQAIEKKFVKNKNPALGPTKKSKFLTGLDGEGEQ